MPERTEWRLNGQRVPLRLTGASTVAQLKARLHHALGMPPAKQKLHIDVCFDFFLFEYFMNCFYNNMY